MTPSFVEDGVYNQPARQPNGKGYPFSAFSLLNRSTACCRVSPGCRLASAWVYSFAVCLRPSSRPSIRPSTRPSLRPCSLSFLLKILFTDIANLPKLSKTTATAKDVPEISATTPIGPCESHLSSFQNTITRDQTTNEETNRPQNAPPIVLTFSRMESLIAPATLASQSRILSLPTYVHSIAGTWTGTWNGMDIAQICQGNYSVHFKLTQFPSPPVAVERQSAQSYTETLRATIRRG